MKRAPVRLSAFAAFAILGLSAVGCGDDAESLPPGEIQVSWLVGVGGCALSGVDTVVIMLTGGGDSGTDVHSFQCNEGEGEITGLDPGNYDLSLRGRDAQGVDRFGEQVENVQVRSGGTTTVQTVRLSALPATINVSWYFENGRFCSFNEVETVDLTLFEDEYEIYATSAACADGELQLRDVQADTYILDVAARDSDGQILFNGQEEVSVDRGDVTSVEVRLEPVTASDL